MTPSGSLRLLAVHCSALGAVLPFNLWRKGWVRAATSVSFSTCGILGHAIRVITTLFGVRGCVRPPILLTAAPGVMHDANLRSDRQSRGVTQYLAVSPTLRPLVKRVYIIRRALIYFIPLCNRVEIHSSSIAELAGPRRRRPPPPRLLPSTTSISPTAGSTIADFTTVVEPFLWSKPQSR